MTAFHIAPLCKPLFPIYAIFLFYLRFTLHIMLWGGEQIILEKKWTRFPIRHSVQSMHFFMQLRYLKRKKSKNGRSLSAGSPERLGNNAFPSSDKTQPFYSKQRHTAPFPPSRLHDSISPVGSADSQLLDGISAAMLVCLGDFAPYSEEIKYLRTHSPPYPLPPMPPTHSHFYFSFLFFFSFERK